MAGFWLVQLTVVTLNILLVIVFVLANRDYCGSIFETQVGRYHNFWFCELLSLNKLLPGYFLCIFPMRIASCTFHSDHVLLGHVMDKAAVDNEFDCQLKCIANNSCKSFNVHSGGNNSNHVCELNNKTRQMKPDNFKWLKGSTYYGSVEASYNFWSILTINFWTYQVNRKSGPGIKPLLRITNKRPNVYVLKIPFLKSSFTPGPSKKQWIKRVFTYIFLPIQIVNAD